MRKSLCIIGILLGLISCKEPKARKPLFKSNQTPINFSVERNRDINKKQQKLILDIIEKEKQLRFVPSQAGYWYAVIEKSKATEYPSSGDQVIFTYQIQTLEGEVVYDENTLGEVNYLVDKEDILPALRYAIKHLKPQETGVFLMPSFLGYGYQGDGDKVGINQPLRFTIHLKSLKKIKTKND
ncbi:MAG: gliding motility-associated peptidyl-prolyl isomerase GldI [Flavobacteriaceae bacterium]